MRRSPLARKSMPMRLPPLWRIRLGEIVNAAPNPGMDHELAQREGGAACVGPEGEGRGRCEDDVEEIVGVWRDADQEEQVRVRGDDLQKGDGGRAVR